MSDTVALLDNTVQVDRKKTATRRARIEEMLGQYGWTVTTSICLLEFKATLLQECITIHDRLRLVGRYTPVVDKLTESRHPQAKLRGHIFRNLIGVFGRSSFEVTEEEDRRLAEKARLRLESIIPRLYKWFRWQSVDAVLHEEIECTRALEPPQKKTVAFAVNLPMCDAGKNKFCRIEEFIRARGRPIMDWLAAVVRKMPDGESSQLKRTYDLFQRVIEQPEVLLSREDCRSCGDLLIALEGSSHATHALSTNARDWRPICEMLGMDFVQVDYPAEARI